MREKGEGEEWKGKGWIGPQTEGWRQGIRWTGERGLRTEGVSYEGVECRREMERVKGEREGWRQKGYLANGISERLI